MLGTPEIVVLLVLIAGGITAILMRRRARAKK